MELNRMIDHTILKADASKEAVMQIIEEAKKYHFYSVCINPAWGCASKRTITRRTSSLMYSDRVSFRSKHIRDKSI
jgi:deoxyribose-phosphate aldolase